MFRVSGHWWPEKAFREALGEESQAGVHGNNVGEIMTPSDALFFSFPGSVDADSTRYPDAKAL